MRAKTKNKRIASLKTRYVSADFGVNVAWKIIRLVILLGLAFMILYPMLVRIVATFMTLEDLIDPTVRFFPRNATMDNLRHVWHVLDFVPSLLNSLLFSGVIAFSQVAVATICGYGFARFKFWGRNVLFAMLMATLLIPPQATLISVFLQFRDFGLLDTMAPFVILTLTGLNIRGGLYVFMMRQYYRVLPKELEEAAYIDGAGPFKTFFYIALPSGVALMVTVFLFSFTWQWTENLYTPLFLPDLQILTRMMMHVMAPNRDVDPAWLSMVRNTAALMVTLPIAVIYLGLQKFFVEGVERSGIVG